MRDRLSIGKLSAHCTVGPSHYGTANTCVQKLLTDHPLQYSVLRNFNLGEAMWYYWDMSFDHSTATSLSTDMP
jgi:hypothetical protein